MLDQKFWQKYFQVYDALNLFIPYQELLKKICDELEIKKGEKILEAGCGTCNLVLEIKKRGGEPIGLDNCPAALDICRRKDPTLKLVLADLRKNLTFPDNYFDKIACNNTLYAMPKNEQLFALKELYRILRPGGKIVISNPKKGWKPVRIYIQGIKQHFAADGLFFSLSKMVKMLIPTIKIFYYNYFIQKESNYCFLTGQEQKQLFHEAGFSQVSESRSAYANQAILNSAIK